MVKILSAINYGFDDLFAQLLISLLASWIWLQFNEITKLKRFQSHLNNWHYVLNTESEANTPVNTFSHCNQFYNIGTILANSHQLCCFD